MVPNPVDIEYELNNIVNALTGEFPNKLLFGVAQRGKIIDGIRDYLDTVANSKRNLNEIRAKTENKILPSQQYNEKYYDKKHRPTKCEYDVGDYVMVRNFGSTPGVGKKLVPKFRGPYEVIRKLRNDRYVIADIDGFQISRDLVVLKHASMAKRLKGL